MKAARVIKILEKNHRNSAMHMGADERALVRFACRYLHHVGYEHTLVRHVVYFLSHCGARLSQTAIALITDRSDRNVRDLAALNTEAFRKTVTFSPKENAGRPPKIPLRFVPLITEYLLTHQVTSKREILRFLKEEHKTTVCWDTLNALLRKYDLERLIKRRTSGEKAAGESSPLFSAVPALPVLG